MGFYGNKLFGNENKANGHTQKFYLRLANSPDLFTWKLKRQFRRIQQYVIWHVRGYVVSVTARSMVLKFKLCGNHVTNIKLTSNTVSQFDLYPLQS